MKFILVIIICLHVLSSVILSQDVPRVISYQGVLVDASGKPEGGTKTLSFTIVNNSGVPHPSGFLHTQTFLLQGGLFYATLGKPNESNMPFPILEGEWNLQISDGTTTYPIIPLYPSVSALNIADNIVTSAKIKDGEVDLVDLKPGTTIGEILKWDGIKWTRSEDEGLRTVSVNSPITGSGVSGDPLRVSIPSGVPVGTVLPFMGDGTDLQDLETQGWYLCDGRFIANLNNLSFPQKNNLQQLLSRAGNPNPGNLPNLSGMFLRGADRGTGVDPDADKRIGNGNKIGSNQDDAIIRHKHRTNSPTPGNNTGSSTFGYHNSNPHVVRGIGDFPQSHSALTDDASAVSQTSSETRPKNVYVNYIIKAR